MALKLDLNITLTREQRQLVGRCALAGGLLLLAAYALVVKPVMDGHRLDKDIARAQATLAQRQKLLPVVAGMNADAGNATLTALMAPAREPLPRAQAYQVTEQLGHMATANGLEPLEVSLNTATMAEDPDSIQVQGMFSGQAEGVYALLMEIGRMKCLARMERVEIRAVDGRLEMMVLLRVALAN
jgi:hypothetical protein